MEPRPYPVTFSVDYPDRILDRLTTFFRIIVAIPIIILLATVDGGSGSWTSSGQVTSIAAGTGGASPAGSGLEAEGRVLVGDHQGRPEDQRAARAGGDACHLAARGPRA